jgi:hypothetical protein
MQPLSQPKQRDFRGFGAAVAYADPREPGFAAKSETLDSTATRAPLDADEVAKPVGVGSELLELAPARSRLSGSHRAPTRG